MFKTITKGIRGTVTVAGEVFRHGTKAASTVASELIATPTEILVGKNAFSDGVRVVNRGVHKATDLAVNVGAPIAGRVMTAPLVKAEHVKDLAVGGAQVALGDREKGAAKVQKAAGGIALAVLTFGLVDEDNLEIVDGVAEAVSESVSGAVAAVAGILDNAGEAMASVFGDTGTAVADAGTASLIGAAPEVLDGVGDGMVGAGVLASAAPDPFAGMDDGLTDAGDVSVHAADAVRFQGRTHAQVLLDLAEPQRVEFVQAVIDDLPHNVPQDVLGLLGHVKRGAWSMAEQALQSAAPHVNLSKVAARVLFSGNT